MVVEKEMEVENGYVIMEHMDNGDFQVKEWLRDMEGKYNFTGWAFYHKREDANRYMESLKEKSVLDKVR